MTPALRTLLALSLCDNYSRWIASRCLPHLGERNIEVGCGIGNVLQYLPNTVGVDPDGRSCDLVHALTEKIAVRFTLSELRKSAHDFDAVVCINVLEHIEDDLEALSQMRGLLKPGGYACILVPAHQWLYGSLDASVGHVRRYGKSELQSKMVAAGFTVTRIEYMNPVGIIGWAVSNLLRRQHPSLWSVMAFDQLVSVLKHLKRPLTGLSVFVVGAKGL
jgi:SAM-dependent methyltransferase